MRVHFHMPRELEAAGSLHDAELICLVCLMVARGQQLEYLRPAWEPAAQDGNREQQKWFPFDTGDTVDIREAVVMGVSDMLPGAGRIPLCWDHLGGIIIQPVPEPKPALLQASGPLPPGLNGKGRGRG